jgi:ATP-dependent helicase/nuclease subunit B
LREALPPAAGPGGTERWLARIALEWAAASDAPASDVLWSQRPIAWIGLRVAADEPLMARLLQAAAAPVLWLDADPPASQRFDGVATQPAPTRLLAPSLEDEAGASAIAVLDALDRGHAPVALIAQDRLVVRRIRALLERAGVIADDETGWALSTTRAGASLMALLRAATPGAGRDALIEALKGDDLSAAASLEDAWRRDRVASERALAAEHDFRERLHVLRGRGKRTLPNWLDALCAAAVRLLETLAADVAGRQVLAALRLDGNAAPAWQAAAADSALDLAAFVQWVDATLEAASFVPPTAPDAQVVITPLARAALRPFGAVVFPACDQRHLGALGQAPTLLPDAVARDFGVPDAAALREREALSFVQVLRAPQVTLLRRAQDGDEALAPSPLLELALLARRRAGQPVPEERAFEAPVARIAREPVRRPAPSMAGRLPERLSASTAEMLRECPYRFFARTALGLTEFDELDAALGKRDHGRWLHAVLHRFHGERRGAGGDDRARLLAAADAVQSELGLDAAALLPFRAAFDNFADRYLDWLHERDASGWRYAGGELPRRCVPPELDGVALDGRLDRIDAGPDGGVMLIDYKSGNADKLRRLVHAPLEDTQLAFYAALLTDEPHEPPPRAIYLALDERGKPKMLEHHDVSHSASLLVEGLADDLAALRAGAGAPALGEGDACRYCNARGLCRRDHWSAS